MKHRERGSVSPDELLDALLDALEERFKARGFVETTSPEALRIQARMDLRTAAAKTGVSAPTIRRHELGAVGMLQPKTIAKIARGLGIEYGIYAKACALVQMQARKRKRERSDEDRQA